MNNNEACAEYFRGNSAYRRCFSEFEKKWKTYGKVTGIITLKNTSEEERRAIGGILGKTFYENTIRFPFAEFEKGLQYTKFAPVDFEQVLEAYFGRKTLTTQERQKEAERGKADFFETVESYLTECKGPDSIAVSWLQDMFSQKKYGYQTVIREYGRDREKTEKLLKTVGKAILLLEDIRETEEEYPLAVFSAEVSGNPHYFDQGTTGGQLLVHGMCYATEEDYPANAHQWRELLLSNGIVPDNISSIVHIYGLRLQVDGDWHPAYDTFCRRQEPCAVTMENLQELTAVHPTGDRVYIVENEMVFSYLLKHLEQRNVTLLCTSGQLRSAAVKLIPFLLNSGADIYYSGDIDPDGIRIADRLWRKYGDRIHVWRMSEEDYAKSLSEEEIGKISMKKLDAVENPVLRETAREVRKKKKVRKPQEEWYRVENTHEAIISEEVFQKVQELIASRRRRQKNGTTQIFSGLVKCADCGWSLAYGVNSQNKNPYAHYHCSKYGQGLRQCSMHYIRYDVLYAYVLARLQYWSMLAQKDEDKLLKRLLNASDRERNSAKKKQAAELKKAEKRKAEVDGLFAKMYEDWSAGRITEYNFNMLSEKYQNEQRELETKIRQLHETMEAAVQTAADAEKWIALMKQYVNPVELTAELLNTLIEKITVHEAVKGEDGSREQEVEIYYRFIGKID